MKKPAILAAILFIASYTFAQTVIIDNSFGTNGMIDPVISANAITKQADGKIVIAGTYRTGTGNPNNIAVARYNTNGTLDLSFNGIGYYAMTIYGINETAVAVAVQADGKIVASGWTTEANGSSGFAIVRFNTNGRPDSTFEADGRVVVKPCNNSGARAMVIQPDGKIIVGGSCVVTGGGPNTDFTLVRYDINGTIDATFDGDGIVKTAMVGTSYDDIRAIKLQPDGKIVVGGFVRTNTEWNDFGIARYNTNGSLDNTFDGDGKVITPWGTSYDEIFDIQIQPDGKIVAIGSLSATTQFFDAAIARYNTDGSIDNTFSSDGIQTNRFGTSSGFGAGVIDAAGNILVAGFAKNTNNDLLFARYTPTGNLDNTFDSDGIAMFDLTGQGANDILIDNNRVYVTSGSKLIAFSMPGVVFPVSLTSFTANANGEDVLLNWTTENEVNLAAYHIEKSFDGQSFTKLSALNATNYQEGKSYSFTDLNALQNATIAYYRLKAIDNDGKFTYSKVVAVKAKSTYAVSVFPNPATNVLKLQAKIRGEVKIAIQTLNGRTVKTIYQTSNTENFATSIDISHLVKGTYLLQVNNETVKFIKQ